MSVFATAYVWEHSQQKGTALLLLLAIADIADKNGRAHPGVPTLARYIRMSERNTVRQIAALEDSGELLIRRNAGPRGTNVFQIVMNDTLPLFTEESRAGARLVDKPGANLSPDKISPDKTPKKGVTNPRERGDTAVSPEPLNQERTGKGAARKRAIPDGFGISDQVRAWAVQHGFDAFLDQHLDYFRDYAKATGRTYADWDAAFINSIRADWGGVRKQALGGRPRTEVHSESEWWKSDDGVAARAKALGVERGSDHFLAFKARVFVAAGDGPWMDGRNATMQRLVEQLRSGAGVSA